MNVLFHNVGGGHSNILVIFSDSVNIFSAFQFQGSDFGYVTDVEVCYCRQGVLEPWNIVERQSYFSLLLVSF